MSEELGLPQPGAVVAGKYRVLHALGRGGMGAVYAATHIVTGRSVALKWLRPKLASDVRASERLLREARAAARIHHPNVVDIYGLEEEDGQAFLVFELLEGETLRKVLERGPLSPATCITLIAPALRGVAAAHAQGVVHRDIKPENVFLAQDPDDPTRRIPKVLDFGISKLAADSPLAEGTLTATGATLGTPHYMSLEQLQGAEVDARSDVYAIGVLLYECLTGKRPFESETFAAIVVKVATESPVHPSDHCREIPRVLGDVVLKAMARVPGDRYATVQALLEALLPFAAGDGEARSSDPSSSEAGPPPPPELPTQTSAIDSAEAIVASTSAARRYAPWLAALLVIVALGSFATRLRNRSSTPAAVVDASAPARQLGKTESVTAPTASAPAAAASEPGGPRDQPAPSVDAGPRAPGTDAPARSASRSRGRFGGQGWVYLGDFAGGRWFTRYFEGWGDGLPRRGARIVATGRSYVRAAMPDSFGSLAEPRTTIGPEDPVKVVELQSWLGGSYVWAKVSPWKR